MVGSKKKIAFLVVCWNNREIIDECIDALLQQTYKHKTVYVIDNASEDGTADHVMKKYKENVYVVKSDINHGFARGNNLLIKEALKDPDVGYIALINSDAVIEKNWTQSILEFIGDKPNVAAAQGITLDYFNRSVIDAAHIYIKDNFQSIQFGYLDSFSSKYDYPRKVFGVNAAAAVYTRCFIEAQREYKLFDEKFFMYLEDVDVSLRALVTGWDNYYIPAAKAFHMGSVSSKKKSSTFNIQWTQRNQAALLYKNLPFHTIWKFLPNALRFERHFYQYIAKQFSSEDAKKVRKNRFIGLLRLPLYFADRRWVSKRRKLSSAQLEQIIQNDGIV